jgi:N-acetylglucosaminyldiphosphoundecaprenol N-acetyl-beta-D-mannosaminyltransferase
MSNSFLIRKSSLFSQNLETIPDQKLLISTLNAYCYNIAQKDKEYSEVLYKSDILLPDGVSVVLAAHLLTGKKLKKIAGEDLFFYEMRRLDKIGGSCFFLGSSESTLESIINRARSEFPSVTVQKFSPPFKPEFTRDDNKIMVDRINEFKPDVLFIGMTAPKQEKWAANHLSELNVKHICCIGAVFDFYAGTIKRAPKLVIDLGMEWFFRLVKEPRRMWRRYVLGNPEFIWLIIKEKYFTRHLNIENHEI